MTGSLFVKVASQLGVDFESTDGLTALTLAELRDFSSFMSEALPEDSSFKRSPAQFQSEVNVINMYNISMGLPLDEQRFGERSAKLEQDARETVLLVTDFEPVRRLEGR